MSLDDGVSQSPERCDHQYALLQRVCNQREDLLTLVQQEHDSQVAKSLIGKTRASHEFQAFDLAKVGGGTQHMYVEELRDIVVPCIRIFLPERSPYCG
jgi:hypothetical protein